MYNAKADLQLESFAVQQSHKRAVLLPRTALHIRRRECQLAALWISQRQPVAPWDHVLAIHQHMQRPCSRKEKHPVNFRGLTESTRGSSKLHSRTWAMSSTRTARTRLKMVHTDIGDCKGALPDLTRGTHQLHIHNMLLTCSGATLALMPAELSPAALCRLQSMRLPALLTLPRTVMTEASSHCAIATSSSASFGSAYTSSILHVTPGPCLAARQCAACFQSSAQMQGWSYMVLQRSQRCGDKEAHLGRSCRLLPKASQPTTSNTGMPYGHVARFLNSS